MTVEEIIRKSITKAQVMQLGTSQDDQPWICTVHFYADQTLNLYWCSSLKRRHSKEIAKNGKAAAYFLVHENTAEEDYVIGISIEGWAELLQQNPESVCKGYAAKLDKDEATLQSLLSGEKPLYKLTPRNIVLFDNKNFPDNPRQEWKAGE